ncbi:hypothetical protein [Chitinophaga filiformis]|uniref:Uncharacterized protein n=1 Tax=Chitinophaga filiformis TaxID=104663 RepID=A0ABY4HSZ7_CHIFI|nr:hypothetical protein [Chitinophaga filiformis]UPK66890.1 hypothetical protein MYF79_18285 [Chitinophaga filiformis]
MCQTKVVQVYNAPGMTEGFLRSMDKPLQGVHAHTVADKGSFRYMMRLACLKGFLRSNG